MKNISLVEVAPMSRGGLRAGAGRPKRSDSEIKRRRPGNQSPPGNQSRRRHHWWGPGPVPEPAVLLYARPRRLLPLPGMSGAPRVRPGPRHRHPWRGAGRPHEAGARRPAGLGLEARPAACPRGQRPGPEAARVSDPRPGPRM